MWVGLDLNLLDLKPTIEAYFMHDLYIIILHSLWYISLKLNLIEKMAKYWKYEKLQNFQSSKSSKTSKTIS